MTTPTFNFVDPTTEQAYARIALDGISGSGKTWTALTLASALGQNIGVIDTEHRTAAKYKRIFRFKHLPLDSYDPRHLIAALAAAGDQGIDVTIIDSLSHFWMGTDGMLEQVDRAGKREGGHGMSGWKAMRPIERQMVEAMLAYPGHLIATMRVKNDWVEGERNGKKSMVKVGTKAEQREGLEYEFDIVGTLNGDNELVVSKSRCPQLAGAVIMKPTIDLGHTIREWLEEDGDAGRPTVAEYRARAITAAGSLEVLRPLLAEVRAAGVTAAPVLDPTGAAVSLGDLIVQLGRQVGPGGLVTPPAQPVAEPVEATPDDPATTDEPSGRAFELLTQIGAASDKDTLGAAWKAIGAALAANVITQADADKLGEHWRRRKAEVLAEPKNPGNDPARRRMMALFTQVEITDRDERLAYCAEVVGHDVATTNDLTDDEVQAVCNRLDSFAKQSEPQPEAVSA